MLFNIYKKEMRDSFRDRRTLILTVLLPILMMTALTFFYESLIARGEDESYTLAVEPSLTSTQELILGSLENVELLETEDPEGASLEGDAHAAIVFAKDFDEQVESGGVGNVEVIGDTTSQNSANLMYLVNHQLGEYEQVVVVDRLQAANVDPAITDAIQAEQQELSSEDSNIMVLTILIPLILSIAIGVGAGPTAADLFAGEKERKTMEALLMTPVKRTSLLLAKFLTILSVGVIIGIITLLVVAIEIYFFTEHLKAAISFPGNTVEVLSMGMLVIIAYSFLIAAILMLTSVIGKTVKEAQSYSSPIMMLLVFPVMFINGLGVNEFTMNHFILPFVNIFAVITELLYGIVNYQHIVTMVASNVGAGIIIYLISYYLFSKDKWVIS